MPCARPGRWLASLTLAALALAGCYVEAPPSDAASLVVPTAVPYEALLFQPGDLPALYVTLEAQRTDPPSSILRTLGGAELYLVHWLTTNEPSAVRARAGQADLAIFGTSEGAQKLLERKVEGGGAEPLAGLGDQAWVAQEAPRGAASGTSASSTAASTRITFRRCRAVVEVFLPAAPLLLADASGAQPTPERSITAEQVVAYARKIDARLQAHAEICKP